MYASHVDDQRLTFFVSGKLWGRSLVMGDKETESDWSHILGKAMAGPLKGKSLAILPAKMTTWKAWRLEHPTTTATMLKPTARMFNQKFMEYTEDFCMGVVRNHAARHWTFDAMKENIVANDEFEGLSLVGHFDNETSSASVWNRKTDHGVLRFENEGSRFIDQQTQSTWDLTRGLAIAGELKGTRLEGTSAIVSYTEAWLRFHPDSKAWAPLPK